MGDKVIGFIGSDKYELILYLSRILYHLGKKVLLVDFSETEALYQSIPMPETLREDSGYIDYRGIDFIQGRYFIWNMEKEYDYILMDFGFHSENKNILRCSKIIFVTDLQLHNLKRINSISYLGNADKYLIIKDVFPCKIKPEFILTQFRENIVKEHVFIIYQDHLDLKCKIQSQYNSSFNFDKLSRPIKCFLKEITKQFDNSLDEKNLNHAYRMAERGK